MADEPTTDDGAVETDPAKLRKLFQRARDGDETAAPAVRRFLRNPDAVGMFGGELARQAEQALVRAAAGDNLDESADSLRRALAISQSADRVHVLGAHHRGVHVPSPRVDPASRAVRMDSTHVL